MKIALIGYGKMGKEIERIAQNRGHSIHLIIDLENAQDIQSDIFRECDVAIEFTRPSSVLSNIGEAFSAGIPIVTGTTGWHEELNSVTEKCNAGNNALFHASNFSIGVNLFFAINEYASKIMNKFTDYEVSMEESHHIHKLDAPSGTAISLANIITENLDRKESWTLKHAETGQIPIKVIREGEITGIHKVQYDSNVDTINLSHNAKNRSGFALGAVLAAEFIYNKQGVFTMSDLLGI